MEKGVFIVLEGIDGCGKSTQSELLGKWLEKQGKKVRVTHEMTDGKIGTLLRKDYLKPGVNYPAIDAMLFAADRIEHVEEKVRPSLGRGDFVVSDRYYLSSLAYQNAQGLPLEWIYAVNKYAIKPDLSILIDVDPEVSIKRVSDSDKIKFEKLEFLKKVRDSYLKLLEFLENHNIKTVDGNKSVEEVHEEIKKIVGSLI